MMGKDDFETVSNNQVYVFVCVCAVCARVCHSSCAIALNRNVR